MLRDSLWTSEWWTSLLIRTNTRNLQRVWWRSPMVDWLQCYRQHSMQRHLVKAGTTPSMAKYLAIRISERATPPLVGCPLWWDSINFWKNCHGNLKLSLTKKVVGLLVRSVQALLSISDLCCCERSFIILFFFIWFILLLWHLTNTV